MNSFPMGGRDRKTGLILVALILSALAALAGDTNVIPIDALPAGGKIYTNAIITRTTPAYAVVSYQDGLVQIPMSNMPAVYQARFGYTPEKAAQFLDEQRQLQQKQRQTFMARQAALEALAGTNRPVRITAIIDEISNGGIPCCSAAGVTGGLLVKNFPDSVRQFLACYRQLPADIADCQRQLDNLKAPPPPPPIPTNSPPRLGKQTWIGSSGGYVRIVIPTNSDIVIARQNLTDRLKALNAELDEKTTNYDRYATIMAYPTGEFFGRKPIWICTEPPAAASR